MSNGPNDDELLLSGNSSIANEFNDSSYDGVFDLDVTKILFCKLN